MTRHNAMTMPEDMLRSRTWAQLNLSDAAHVPISFVLGGKAINGIPEDWQPTCTRRRIDANIIETVIEATDPVTGLSVRVECAAYMDHPVVEWVAWLTNKGTAPTPLIQDILAMDGTVQGASPVLCHGNGDFCGAEGYTPQETSLPAGDAIGFAPNGGRACDGAFPYYRLTFKDWGLSMAVGWPTQWAARFKGVAEGVHIQAGQERTHLRLMPGESIRTPRMTVLFWSGDASRAVNLWRRWYLAHILPRPDGQPMQPHLACCGTDEGEEFTAATEANQIRYIGKFNRHGIHPDVWWIDAGWYPCYNRNHERKWRVTGDWRPDPERFPRGLKPVSDQAAQYGADLLVWFEPERIHPEASFAPIRREWLRGDPECRRGGEETMGLVDLGNPECRQWLTDHVCRLIQANGIKIYRQDHNFAPLEYWHKDEPQDRQGLTENLYAQGYLQFWDDLLARNPGLWIDSCASGGRRNDLETMRRSVPLHYTDFGYGNHPVKLAFHHTMFEWLPYFKECTLSWDMEGTARFDHRVDSYSYHCGMGPMLFATLDIRRDDYDYALAGRMIDIWRRAAGLMLNGDYYPLTPLHRTPEQWVARQFDRPEEGLGFIQAIRLPAAPEDHLVVRPEGLHPDVVYRFENPETGETRECTGRMAHDDGFDVALPKRQAAIWFYRALARHG